jgi:hypothetical protein
VLLVGPSIDDAEPGDDGLFDGCPVCRAMRELGLENGDEMTSPPPLAKPSKPTAQCSSNASAAKTDRYESRDGLASGLGRGL